MAISGVADLTGRVLAGRYRLLAPIGAGASGRVYVADDVRLRRRVAIKVLHAALAEDSGFLRRFRAEAQVAASLNHPNVDGGVRLGRRRRALHGARVAHGRQPAQPARLRRAGSARRRRRTSAAQVTSALEYAHVRGVVHRDIKPANLLFDEHGIVRVADFGLARALAEASWTEPGGRGRRHRALRRAGAGHRRAARRPRRSLLARDRALRVGHGHRAQPRRRPRSARSPRARPRPSSRRWSSVGSGRWSSAPAVPIPRRGIPTRRRCATCSPTRRAALPPPQPLALSGLFGDFDTGEPTQLGRALQTLQVFDQDASEPPAPAPGPLVVQERRRRAPGAQPMVSVVVTLVVVLALVFAGYAVATSTASTVAAPSVVGLATDAAKVRVAEAGLSITLVERARRRPQGHGDRGASRSGPVRTRARRRRARRVARAPGGDGARHLERGVRRRRGRAAAEAGFRRVGRARVQRHRARGHGRADGAVVPGEVAVRLRS